MKKRSSRSREQLIKANLANPRLVTRMLYTTYQCVASEKYHIFPVASNRSHYCTYLIGWLKDWVNTCKKKHQICSEGAILSAILVIVMMMMTIRVAPGSCKWKPQVSSKERRILNEKVTHGTMNHWFQNYWPPAAGNMLLNLLLAFTS